MTHGAANGMSLLALDDWAGVKRPEDDLRGLEVTDAQGHTLPVEPPRGPHEGGPTWTVTHAPGALLRVHYAFVAQPGTVPWGRSGRFRPHFETSFFHAMGCTSLVYVRESQQQSPVHIQFHWQGFAERGWQIASSYSVERADFDVTTTLEEFRRAVFLAGDIRLVRRDVGSSQAPLWLAIAGNDWGFTDDAWADRAAAVVKVQRTFFQDFDWPFFLISVVPMTSHGIGGTGLAQSFALTLEPKTTLDETVDGAGPVWLLGHELFHMWNGVGYEFRPPAPAGYCFSEGFTNFYAHRLLFRAGLLSARAFVANLNDAIAHYAASPVRLEPATRIVKDYWNDSVVHDLPYQRGDVVALLVDAEIRRTSAGSKNLDDLMKGLLAVRRQPAPEVSSETFLAAIESYTSPAFASRMRAIAADGSFADVDPTILEPCLHGHIASVPQFDLGLDESAAHAPRFEVSEVSPGTNAYRAGLRNGQRIASWTYAHGDPRHPVEITLRGGDTPRTIRYLPEGKPTRAVQFTADAELPAACASML